MEARDFERRSSAATLSDMEIFVFPELMFSLVLANILSPVLWRWREDPWFAGVREMNPNRRLQRLKQYVMDHYVFNLDLETWGLTKQAVELKRFAPFLSPEEIAQSNALFGYAGDVYYYDLDIRTHFGLDKYATDTIPYWKTETVEAMDAFRRKPGFSTGAGECVSLAALYAAALFVVAGLPLERIFLMATPLHSQNFIDVGEGILLNNRRLVTKAMWFNGTQLSAQARRALEHERVTIVSHASGFIHMLYPRATISPEAYSRFSSRLSAFLKTPLTPAMLGNFLRQDEAARRCFVIRSEVNGAPRYLPLADAFRFEAECAFRVTDSTRPKLLAAIPAELFDANHKPGAIVLDDVEAFIRGRRLDLDAAAGREALAKAVGCSCLNAREMVKRLAAFCATVPRLPDASRVAFDSSEGAFALDPAMTREEIAAAVEAMRGRNVTADCAFYAFRDFSRTDPAPFIRAALARNPVCVLGAKGLETPAAILERLASWPGESIYEGASRFAQPDEVWNFRAGDGWEKLLTLASILRSRGEGPMRLEGPAAGRAVLRGDSGREIASLPSAKSVPTLEL